MPMKQAPKKQYRTANGKQIDMDLLRQRNELTPAIGNVRVNARGDELGPGGKIVRKREDILQDFYKKSEEESKAQLAAQQSIKLQGNNLEQFTEEIDDLDTDHDSERY